MKIRSQNRENLINYDSYDYKIRNNKHIIAYSNVMEILLGTYQNEENCKEIIDRIINAYKNKENIFNMP